jgi:diacylglycerol kinase family enzyme
MALACNTQHTGAGMRIAPKARLDDGLLDLIIVPALSRMRLLTLMNSIPNGLHLEAPELCYRQVSKFELLAGPADGPPGTESWRLNVDGEILGESQETLLSVSVCPGALNLFQSRRPVR